MLKPWNALPLLCFGLLAPSHGDAAPIERTERGAVVETAAYRVEFRDAVLVSLFNKLTREEYLDSGADLSQVVPHLPSGLGTQHGEPARAASEKLLSWPWWEHPNDLHLPNQHFPSPASAFTFAAEGESRAVLTYRNLTDGKENYPDEAFSLILEVDGETGDLLVTPHGVSPRPGVHSANLTLAPCVPAITAEAPICDGVRLRRENTGQVLWVNRWPSYWDFGFLALNGWKKGAFGIWTQDKQIRYYKTLFYLNNREGLSFSFSMMSVPPFEELKECRSPLPWRIQAFDKSWAQAAARFRAWRDDNVRLAPRPEFAKRISYIQSVPGPEQRWLEDFLRYIRPYQGNAAAFIACVRKASFDTNHTDNTPKDSFKEDTKRWRAAGTYGMAYLQPMILWSPKPTNEREQAAVRLSAECLTHSAFLKDPTATAPYIDQHHLGHPGWQRWFLDWVREWCRDYGAQGIYHDQSYAAPLDRRGLAVGGMTTPEGTADYFYKAATENPDTFHGTEKITEANLVAVSNSIGSGYHWGTAPNMRLARVESPSPVCAALSYPLSVIWSFVRLRGDSTWDLRERHMQEGRAQIAGAIDGPSGTDPAIHGLFANVPWHDATRDRTFLQYRLRPYFPDDYSPDVLSYFRGQQGEEFRYERTAWGTRFVRIAPDGQKTVVYGTISGVYAAAIETGGIQGWVVYNQDDPNHTWNRTGPSGLHPDRWYLHDPRAKRPPVYFSTNQGYGPSFYESYAEDGFANEFLAFLRLRLIERLVDVLGRERVDVHCPEPPKAVFVNGKPVKAERQGETNVYTLSVGIPADICVIVKSPPPGLDRLHEAAALRVTERRLPVDFFVSPEMTKRYLDGGMDKDGRKVLQGYPAVGNVTFGFNYGQRDRIYVPLTPPAGSKGGAMKVHLNPASFVEVSINAVARPDVPPVLEIPLKPDEVVLLSLVSGRVGAGSPVKPNPAAFEWVEGM
jgi:hypothetical protein